MEQEEDTVKPDIEGGVDLPEATTEKAKTISAIDRTTVHQICSGQVVLNLATAVKELVENSLDAGATSIEVRLKDHGASFIEVSDNGSGVEEDNFQGLTLKHHTSKLREFQDLVGVETFGFRGEALSSLCALANVSISTRHANSQLGSTIEYDHNGRITNVEKSARGIGTTVMLQDIFSTMPVRFKEFQRNIKKEFSRLCQVLNSYCLVSTGVRIQCVNTVGKGKRNIVLSTKGEDNVKDNITSVFGSKQSTSLREIKQAELSVEDLQEIGIKSHNIPDVKLSGYISNCNYGEGRGASDRQFYYINSRPCDPTKISKLVNEVFHFYNRTQYPFVYLNILTQRTTVDVNITPDKRQVFLQNEKYLCYLIKKSLDSMFKDAPRDIAVNLKGAVPLKIDDKENVKNQEETLDISTLKRKLSSMKSCSPEKLTAKPARKQPKMDFFIKKLPKESNINNEDSTYSVSKTTVDCMGDSSFTPKVEPVPEYHQKNVTDPHNIGRSSSIKSEDSGLTIVFEDKESLSQSQPSQVPDESCEDITINNIDPVTTETAARSVLDYKRAKANRQPEIYFDDYASLSQQNSSQERKFAQHSETEEKGVDNTSGLKICFDDFQSLSQQSSHKESGRELRQESKSNSSNENNEKCVRNNDIIQTSVPAAMLDDSSQSKPRRKTKNVKFSMESLQKSLEKIKLKEDKKKVDLKFSAKISPQENQNAEKELMRQISKTDFARMSIYGQFNLGFIIAGLDRDLFIIDQHATDEKYNFEMLQQTTVINSQPMVTAQALELTAVNENILMDNLEVFHKNGFKFQIDEDAPATQRVKLSHLPISKNWSFGKQDIDELIFIISESAAAGAVLRPSRVRAMFASRACRKSIMIGKSLSKDDMRQLVKHMGEIEQPWNCPHGRPTIRHLVNTDLV